MTASGDINATSEKFLRCKDAIVGRARQVSTRAGVNQRQ